MDATNEKKKTSNFEHHKNALVMLQLSLLLIDAPSILQTITQTRTSDINLFLDLKIYPSSSSVLAQNTTSWL